MGICRTAAYKVGHKNTKKSVAEQKKICKNFFIRKYFTNFAIKKQKNKQFILLWK